MTKLPNGFKYPENQKPEKTKSEDTKTSNPSKSFCTVHTKLSQDIKEGIELRIETNNMYYSKICLNTDDILEMIRYKMLVHKIRKEDITFIDETGLIDFDKIDNKKMLRWLN